MRGLNSIFREREREIEREDCNMIHILYEFKVSLVFK